MKQYYGLIGQECLNDTPEETIIEMFDNEPYEEIEKHKFPVQIHIFRPTELTLNGEDILTPILENLDEDYGYPDTDHIKASAKMLEAAESLVEIIKKEYKVWICEPTGETIKYSKDEVFNIIKD